MHEYDLAWGSVAPNALEAAASQAGVRGRVITAVAFKGGRALYLSYGWTRAATAQYEAKVVPTTFDDVRVNAARLAGEGYIITALGGDDSDGFLLVGTRVSGQTAPRHLEIATDSAASVPVDPPEAQLARRQVAKMLESAVSQLSDIFRTVFVLREIEGLSIEETAEVLDIPPQTVKTRHLRARRRLRQASATKAPVCDK